MKNAVRIAVYARSPEPGRVKTRLIPALGAEGAARLYRAMAEQCIASACAALPGSVELWCTPCTSDPFLLECRDRWGIPLRRQSEGDLGGRMSATFRSLLSEAGSALVMGSDVPSIGAADIRSAAQLLAAGRDAVFCPVEDGGYGLVGLGRHSDELFSGIDWGTGAVMGQTRAKLRALGWNHAELPLRWDVDAPQDLERLFALFPRMRLPETAG